MTYETSTTGVGAKPCPPPANFMTIAFWPWQVLSDVMTERKTRAALSALDDHLLKDIGISRSEIAWRSRAANLPERYR